MPLLIALLTAGCASRQSPSEAADEPPCDGVNCLSLARRHLERREPTEDDYRRGWEALVTGCHSGHAATCRYLLESVGGPKPLQPWSDFAVERLDGLCREGDANGCNELMQALVKGRALPRDPERARTLAETSCNLDDDEGCYHLALMDETGMGAPMDKAAAKSRYASLCEERRHGKSCQNLAVMYASGVEGPVDEEKSAELYRQSCGLGNAISCGDFGNRQVLGRGVELDVEAGLSLLDRTCSRGDGHACMLLGLHVMQGKAGPPDGKRAESAFTRSCDAGEAMGCYYVAVLLAEQGNHSLTKTRIIEYVRRGEALAARGCGTRHGRSCRYRVYFHRLAILPPVNREVMQEWLDTACEVDPRLCPAGVPEGPIYRGWKPAGR